jgi:hypothetical protein
MTLIMLDSTLVWEGGTNNFVELFAIKLLLMLVVEKGAS